MDDDLSFARIFIDFLVFIDHFHSILNKDRQPLMVTSLSV